VLRKPPFFLRQSDSAVADEVHRAHTVGVFDRTLGLLAPATASSLMQIQLAEAPKPPATSNRSTKRFFAVENRQKCASRVA
jgi:hypothetical protein